MATSFESQRTECRELLEKQVETLSTAKEEALATVRQADELLRPLRRALAGFGDHEETKKSRRTKKPCSTKPEIIGLIHDVLNHSGETPRDELKQRVTQALRDRGRNLSMFARLFVECLDDPSLHVNGIGVVSPRTAVGRPSEGRSSWLPGSEVEGGDNDERG